MLKPPQVYVGPELAAYGFGQGHPFGPDRMHAFWREAVRQGLDRKVAVAAPAMADRAAIERFHTGDYVERVIRLSELGYDYLDAGDTPAFKGSMRLPPPWSAVCWRPLNR